MEKDIFKELHRLCRRNELYQQKLWGIGIALFGIGLQAFAGEFLFGAVTVLIIAMGLYIFAQRKVV